MPKDLQRSIVHLDADAFFASVEQAADPRLRGRPIAVGGEKRGIIASASYEARQFGIYTPMPTVLARRLCPRLILLPGDFEKYELFSRLMFSYVYDFTPEVEIGSIDEGYFDLSQVRKPAVEIAETIRRAIRQSLKLSVSEGIASNKLVSQVASKLKKPSAFEQVPAGAEAAFLAPLPNKWLPGIGPKAASHLATAGLAQIGQIARTPVELLGLLVGRRAAQLREFSLGIDDRPVVTLRAAAQSYGQQETFPADTTDEVFLDATLRRMADQLMARVRQDGRSIRTVTVKVRYNDMDETQSSESLREPTDQEPELYSLVSRLLRRAWQRRVSLRLVSLKFSNIYQSAWLGGLALDPDSRRQDNQQRLSATIDSLRGKFGRGVLLRGHDFILRVNSPDGEESQPAASPVPIPAREKACGNNSCKRTPPEPGETTARSMSRRSPLVRAAVPARSLELVPLHVHSYYSFLDSTLSIEAIVDWARRHNLPAIALTDRNNLHGAVEFAQAATAAGIKPIIGVELDLGPRQFRLYAQNQEGYRNLCAILNRRNQASSPAPDPGTVFYTNTAGLLAAGTDPAMADYFPGRFYLEALPLEESPSASALSRLASFPVHYETPADRWKFDIVQSIRTLTLLRQAHPAKRVGGHYHFLDGFEAARRFGGHPELAAGAAELAARCSFAFETGKPQFPGYAPPDGSSPADFLRRLALAGLCDRYPRDFGQRLAQVEQELAIILEVGYEEYFLVMWDILQECRRRGIDWITRGSAADSLVCYCLGISGVCPIRFDLYFRRFLNKDRMALHKLPDIDVDFPHDRKDDVVNLIFEKFGPGHTAVVGGFSTFQARSAFAEVAKVLGVSDFQVRRLTERFPHHARAGQLAEALAAMQECRELPLCEEPYSTALKMAEFLDGFPRYPKMHPCGVILSRQPMEQLVPCFTSAKGYAATHFDMDSVEEIGLVKMDILAQGGLAVMRDVQAMVPEPLNLDKLAPWDDPEVWDLIANGGARAVHHIESPAMISLCRMCQVSDIDTLIAIVSVIRPGAANENKKTEFARRYQGLSPVVYPHASLEPCLRGTCGLVVYEEHILQICEAFAALPAGRADILRRALGKEKVAVIDQIKAEFADCARKQGRSEAEIATVWGLVSGFRGYAFCKAHSTAYGVEAYQSAWLKHHYPAQFMAAVLSNGKGFYHPLVYILECHRLGLGLLGPTLNSPGPQFAVVNDRIRVPVLQLKGLSRRTGDTLIAERGRRPFVSMADFIARVAPPAEDVDILIRAGAFDEFGESRTRQFWQARSLGALVRHEPGSVREQLWLLPPGNLDGLDQVPLQEPAGLERLRAEEELLGYPVSGHPLDLFPDVAWHTYCPINRLGQYIGRQVVTCGLVIEQRLYHQVTGEPMKFMTIADHTGIVETELFARTYRFYGLTTIRYRVLEITATVEPFENRRGYTLRVIRAGKARTLSQCSCPAPPPTSPRSG